MTCEDYLRDPEANASHLEACGLCRAMIGDLDREVEVRPRPLEVDALPLAGWEGAAHRTWPLVSAGAAAMLTLAIVLFVAAGTPPLRGLAGVVTSGMTTFEAVAKFFQLLGSGIHSAPTVVHITVAVLFLVINTILVLLLRRAPKGIDV
jgi:hypothetical protein